MYTCYLYIVFIFGMIAKKTIEGPYFYLRKRINVSLKLERKMFSEHHEGVYV